MTTAHIVVGILLIGNWVGKINIHWLFCFTPYAFHLLFWVLIYLAAHHVTYHNPDSNIMEDLEEIANPKAPTKRR